MQTKVTRTQAKGQGGYVLLLSVLVLGAIVTTTTTTVLLLGLGSDRSSFATQQSHSARSLANTCADEALERLSRDNTYASGETLTLANGVCTVDGVLGTGDTNRTVQASGVVGTIVRKVEVEIAAVGPPMVVTTWQDVADY